MSSTLSNSVCVFIYTLHGSIRYWKQSGNLTILCPCCPSPPPLATPSLLATSCLFAQGNRMKAPVCVIFKASRLIKTAYHTYYHHGWWEKLLATWPCNTCNSKKSVRIRLSCQKASFPGHQEATSAVDSNKTNNFSLLIDSWLMSLQGLQKDEGLSKWLDFTPGSISRSFSPLISPSFSGAPLEETKLFIPTSP